MRKLRKLSELTPEQISEIKTLKIAKNTICYNYQISYETLNKILKS